MTVSFRRSFERDLRAVASPALRARIRQAIEAVEQAERLADLPNARRLSGSDGMYRLRVGDYRIGLVLDGDRVEFVRVLHRREIYRRFP